MVEFVRSYTQAKVFERLIKKVLSIKSIGNPIINQHLHD